MKSRYSAYALHIPKYIIETTHKQNQEFNIDTKTWEYDILQFCKNCNFEKLTIIEYIDGKSEAYVSFKAQIKCDNTDASFTEKSRFYKEYDKWYYVDGIFLDKML